MYRPVKEELSRDEQEDLLKKLLYQQGMCLLIYPEVIHPISREVIPLY
jgi:hypothetical protein